MPFPKNWVEELVLEWLLLRGYLAISNVRLESEKVGGVKEADILGLKYLQDEKVLEIQHIETGSLAQKYDKNLKSIEKKFTPERKEAVKSIFSDVTNLKSFGKDPYYNSIYIAEYVPKKQINKLRNELNKYKISFWTLEEITLEIIKDIDKWKQDQKDKKRRATTSITLPENWWLLKLIDFMKSKGLIKVEHK